MNKKLLAGLVSALLTHSALAFDPFQIKDIRVEGIQRTEAGTVFSYLPVKVGDTMNDEKAAAAIKTLFATGFFKDVRLEIDGQVLVVVLEERPAIASLEFTGLKAFKPEDLKKSLREVGLAESRIFDRAMVERAEQELKRQYLAQGHYAVQVTTTITPLERNRVGVNFAVEEGEIAKIKQDWAANPRWKGVKRGYTAEDVYRLRGSVQIEHTLAKRGAEKLWKMAKEMPFVNSLGAVTGNQAMQQVLLCSLTRLSK